MTPALRNFSAAIKMLPKDEQRELFQLLFQSVTVHEGGKAIDTANENTKRKRQARRQLTVEVKLRTDAIQTLFGIEEPTKGRKHGFNLTLEIAHSRTKPTESYGLLSPIQKECGRKAPKTRKRPKKTEHEIHRAIRWKNEMNRVGIGQNEFARRKGLSVGAVSHVMKWLRLSPKAVKMILNLNSPEKIRKLSRKVRELLIEKPQSEQIEAISNLIN